MTRIDYLVSREYIGPKILNMSRKALNNNVFFNLQLPRRKQKCQVNIDSAVLLFLQLCAR